MNKREILDRLYADLKKNGMQSSWDFEADMRFAEIIGDKESYEILHDICRSNAVGGSMWHWRTAAKLTGIPQKRLYYLRLLVKDHMASAWWIGLGPGGRNEFNTGRLRTYEAI